MQKMIRCLVNSLLLLSMFCLTAGSALAASWPSKPVTVICPYAAGGDGDLTSRLWAEFAEKKLGQSVLVVNKTGGGGMVGTSFAASAKPDGYTLFLAQAGPILITPNVAKTTYTFDSFDYVCRIIVGNCALVVKGDAPWNDLNAFISDCKANPDKYIFASPGATTWLGFAMRDFIQKADIPVKIMEFQGSAPALTSILGEHSTFTFCFPQNYVSQTKAGQVKILAIGEKTQDFPEAQTFEEQGFPGSYYGWGGIATPKGVPAEIRQKLTDITAEMVTDPNFIEKAKNIHSTPSFLNEENWLPVLKEQDNDLSSLIKNLGLEKK